MYSQELKLATGILFGSCCKILTFCDYNNLLKPAFNYFELSSFAVTNRRNLLEFIELERSLLTGDSHSGRFLDVLEPRHDLALNDEVDSNPELDPFLDHEFLKKENIKKCTFAILL